MHVNAKWRGRALLRGRSERLCEYHGPGVLRPTASNGS